MGRIVLFWEDTKAVMMMLEVVVGSLGSTSMASEDLVLTDILGMNLKGVYYGLSGSSQLNINI